MNKVIGLLGLIVVLGGAGCAVEPVGYTHAGVSVGVYEEYPRTYYGHRHYRRAPYDRDHYFYRYPRYRHHPYWR
jgi:hypothetical protein